MWPEKLYSSISAELQKATVEDTKPLIILLSLLLDNLFIDKALLVPCKLGNKGKIETRFLLDTDVTSIGFIDKKMARRVCHVLQILFFSLAKPKPLKKFNGKLAKPITHAIYPTLIIQGHFKLLAPIFVTLLS